MSAQRKLFFRIVYIPRGWGRINMLWWQREGGGSSLGWAAGWEGMVGRGLARREGRESS